VAQAQIQMPDARQMSGIPRPVDDLPTGSVSVRLVRGDLSNNIAGHPVELRVGTEVRTASTDESGRAQFDGLPAGTPLKASAVVDGERLDSEEFPAPARGGIRLLLVAADPDRAAREAAEASAPAIAGDVLITRESQLVVEPDDERVRVYYLLNISNTARSPVNPSSPFVFDVPREAVGTAVLEGSSPLASVTGTRVAVQGPFPPGPTFVQVAYILPVSGGEVEIVQAFPAPLEHLAVIVRKEGEATLSSPLIARQQEMPAGGELYIAATGDRAVAAGQPIALSIAGLPHHSTAPRWIALSLAVAVAIAGVWAARGRDAASTRDAERRQLVARRERLFQELVRLEQDHRRGRGDASRYPARREELVAALERVYGALEPDDPGPEAAGRHGLAR
jgi:hypothetical protein